MHALSTFMHLYDVPNMDKTRETIATNNIINSLIAKFFTYNFPF